MIAGVDRAQALADQMVRRDELKGLADNPHVQAWFVATEQAWTRAMLDCGVADDEGRRSAALRIQALRQLREFLKSEVARGNRAEDRLAKKEGVLHVA